MRGTAKLTARAARDQVESGATELVMTGVLADDAGEPLSQKEVKVRVTRDADPNDRAVADAMRGARACVMEGRARAWALRPAGTTDAPELVVVTDEDGRFCFRARLDPDRYTAALAYAPDARSLLAEGVTRQILFDLSKRGLALRFDPAPRILSLDAPQAAVEAVAIGDDDGNPRVAPGIALVLQNEAGATIGQATTDSAGRARFLVASTAFGPPGPGELVASFAGNAEVTAARYVEDVERHARVSIRVPGELKPGVPEDGIALAVEVQTVLGPVLEGSVEARVGDVVVGAAPVDHGTARLLLTFASQGNEALVRLRYVPASPWYEAGLDPVVRLPIRGPTLLSKAPLLLAGLAVLAFFLAGRFSAQKSKVEPAPPPLAPGDGQEGRARLDVLRPAARGVTGWSGRVVDAHEGYPLPGVRVWIDRGTFEGRTLLASTETDAEGRFALPAIADGPGAQLHAEGRLHARLSQDLPPSGELAVALAERRRAVLARLVQWAKRRGSPFDAKPEPTPGHVRRAALGDEATARWAAAVERAAFGPDAVDARAEQDVDRLAPPGPPTDR